MKRILLTQPPTDMPSEIASYIQGADIYDSSCSSEARVYFVDKDGGFYIKTSKAGTLKTEAEMARYYHKIGLGVKVLSYVSSGSDWLVTESAIGEDCTHQLYLDDPKRLCEVLGESLRMLHDTPFDLCPVQNRTEIYSSTVDLNFASGMFDKDLFSGSVFGLDNAKEAYAVFNDGREGLTSRVLLHGDYCLPNVILDNWKLSAFIDVGNGGVGDRHIDLFWAAWTLWYNLKTFEYTDRIFDAYGRDKVNTELLRVVAAAETFG